MQSAEGESVLGEQSKSDAGELYLDKILFMMCIHINGSLAGNSFMYAS